MPKPKSGAASGDPLFSSHFHGPFPIASLRNDVSGRPLVLSPALRKVRRWVARTMCITSLLHSKSCLAQIVPPFPNPSENASACQRS